MNKDKECKVNPSPTKQEIQQCSVNRGRGGKIGVSLYETSKCTCMQKWYCQLYEKLRQKLTFPIVTRWISQLYKVDKLVDCKSNQKAPPLETVLTRLHCISIAVPYLCFYHSSLNRIQNFILFQSQNHTLTFSLAFCEATEFYGWNHAMQFFISTLTNIKAASK